MSGKLDQDIDIYLQNLKMTSKKPGILGISILFIIMCFLISGFFYFRGIIGFVLLFMGFFVFLMIIGSFMVTK